MNSEGSVKGADRPRPIKRCYFDVDVATSTSTPTPVSLSAFERATAGGIIGTVHGDCARARMAAEIARGGLLHNISGCAHSRGNLATPIVRAAAKHQHCDRYRAKPTILELGGRCVWRRADGETQEGATHPLGVIRTARYLSTANARSRS